MKIVLLETAEDDLQQFESYFVDIHPDIWAVVQKDIVASLAFIRDFPLAAQAVEGHQLRRRVTRKYKYTIAYRIVGDVAEIIGIFRHQDREF